MRPSCSPWPRSLDEPDEFAEQFAGQLYAPLRQRGHSKEGRDANPQVVIALAVTRDGMPVRSWVLPGNTADVATVARIKQDLHAWQLGRCLFVGDAGMYSARNLVELSGGLGRYVLAVPMRRVQDVEAEVLTRPGRYRPVADNLQVKEVWVGDSERRKRYVLCVNPQEAERQRLHRQQMLMEIDAELAALDRREDDHPKAACALMASKPYGRYLSADRHGRPKLDAAKVKAAEKFDGKFVVTTKDVALAYKAGAMIESYFRRMKQTGLEVRPMVHWTARRIEAHVKLCVLPLQTQRSAEIRTALPWAHTAHTLAALEAVRYHSESRTIVQRTKISSELAGLLKKLGISAPKQLMAVIEAAETHSPA
jgi:transposase